MIISSIYWNISQLYSIWFMFSLIIMMKMINCFCGMVDRWKEFSLISSWDHCQKSPALQVSDTPRAAFEHVQNLSSGFVEWSYAVVITTTPGCHYFSYRNHFIHFTEIRRCFFASRMYSLISVNRDLIYKFLWEIQFYTLSYDFRKNYLNRENHKIL